ncbi:MAG TPA: glutathione S-transferase family protein [Dongiaceae bacterium]|jgi:glutathione S-transferase|nr:glutathione S-transferase family protein [Dongiaceae bacterium]
MRKLLYSNGSPYARRVRIVLLEKGLPFESDVLDAVRPVENIRPHNPALQIPVLYDGERRLFGSNLILQYLFDRYPAAPQAEGIPLAPSVTRRERHWDDMQILAAIEAIADSIVNVRLLSGLDPSKVPYLERQLVRVASCLDWLEPQLSAEGFWPGTFSLMDINLLCPLLFGEKRGVFAFRGRQWPNVEAMIDRWQPRPSVAATPVGDLPPRS